MLWRALFLALGVSSCILGLEALAVEKAVLNVSTEAKANGQPTVVSPPDWAPWSLMSGGAVVMLYSFTIPNRNK